MEEHLSREQKESIISAGASAYRAAFLPSGNPYNRSPHRELWMKGYTQAQHKFLGTTQKPKHFKPRPKEQQRPRQDRQDRPVISVGKIAHFNRKHQTQAV